MNTLDATDQQLVALLAKDARQDSRTLAKQLNVSAATVRRRLSRLLQGGVLRIVGVVDPAKFGMGLLCLIGFNVAHERLESALEALAERPEVRWASITTGRFDVLAMARFSSNDDLAHFVARELPRIDGIQDCETFICLNTKKLRYASVHPL